MLTIIENDQDNTIRVHGSECKDVAKDSQGSHLFVSKAQSKVEALGTIADNQGVDVEEIEGFVTFLPCCGR